MHIQFESDWRQRWTASEAESALTGFKFDGPGWYRNGKQVILAVPMERPSITFWDREFRTDEYFRFYVYDNHDPITSFIHAVNAPIRKPHNDT